MPCGWGHVISLLLKLGVTNIQSVEHLEGTSFIGVQMISRSMPQFIALTKQDEDSMVSGLCSLFSVGWRQDRESALVFLELGLYEIMK